MEDSVFATVALPIALAVIMTVLGLALTPADFRRVVVLPRGVAIGLSNLIVISPLLAFAVAEAYALDPALAVGLVILGAAPGGTMANMLTHLARGDTALSITLTAISSVAAVITVPLYLELATNHFGAGGFDDDVGMGGVVARVLLITVIPLSLGMYIRSRSPERVAAIEPRAKAIALGLFLAVVIGAVISEYERVFDNLDDVAAAAVTLNVAAMAVAFAISRRRAPRRPPVDGDRDRAGDPQRDARDRGRGDDLDRAHDPRRRLQRVHVHHRGPVRPGDVQAKHGRRRGDRGGGRGRRLNRPPQRIGLKAPAGTASRSTPGGNRGARRDSSAGPRRRR